MGQASSSSASTAAINSTGGALVVNQPLPLTTWFVIGAVLLLGLYLWRKR